MQHPCTRPLASIVAAPLRLIGLVCWSGLFRKSFALGTLRTAGFRVLLMLAVVFSMDVIGVNRVPLDRTEQFARLPGEAATRAGHNFPACAHRHRLSWMPENILLPPPCPAPTEPSASDSLALAHPDDIGAPQYVQDGGAGPFYFSFTPRGATIPSATMSLLYASDKFELLRAEPETGP